MAVDIRRRVAYIKKQDKDALSEEYWTALTTMNYVQNQVVAEQYGYIRDLSHGEPLPSRVPDFLSQRAGICWAHAMTYQAISRELGLKTRRVQILDIDKPDGASHMSVEVWSPKYENWFFLDVSWGGYFRKQGGKLDELLSLEDVLKHGNPRKLLSTNESNAWTQCYARNTMDPYAYLTSDHVRLVYMD